MFGRLISKYIFVSPFYIIFLVCLLCSTNTVQSQSKRAYKVKEDTIISFKDRWSVKTNAVGWLMTIPNAAVEFDISNSVYNKLTLNLEGKYNGYTSHNFLPYMVMNYWEVRPEVRKYWRTDFRANSGTKPTLYEKLFSKQRVNPRYWRAYYLGGYLNAGGYDLKFSENGVQGKYIGAGVTAGYSIPLYSYKKGYIDLELGGSLGLMMTRNNKFALDRENNVYIPTSDVRNWHIVPFPVVSDLRVAFVFRFKSIKDKYKRIDHAKIQAREAAKLEKRRIKDSIRVAKHMEDSLQDLRKKFVKDSIRAAKLLEDSLEEQRKIFVKDSIANAKKALKESEAMEAAKKKEEEEKNEKEQRAPKETPLKENEENNDNAVIKEED